MPRINPSVSLQITQFLKFPYDNGSLRYPCQNQGAQSVSAIGHSSAVGRVRFNADGTALLSIGQESRAVLQYSLLAPELTA